MTDKTRRIVGLVIAPLLILLGLWLCFEGVWQGKLSGIFWIGQTAAKSCSDTTAVTASLGLSNGMAAIAALILVVRARPRGCRRPPL
jgi:hypothetical protein